MLTTFLVTTSYPCCNGFPLFTQNVWELADIFSVFFLHPKSTPVSRQLTFWPSSWSSVIFMLKYWTHSPIRHYMIQLLTFRWYFFFLMLLLELSYQIDETNQNERTWWMNFYVESQSNRMWLCNLMNETNFPFKQSARLVCKSFFSLSSSS